MKHKFRPTLTALEARLVLSTTSAAHKVATTAVVTPTPKPTAPLVPLAVASTTLTHLFEDTLGRTPDGYALAVGVPAMQAGVSMAQMTTGLVSSPEYIAQHVSATASSVANETAYVSSLYSTVLGRTADSAGLNAWVNAIETRALTLNQVAAAIVGSPEAATSSTSILVQDSFPVVATNTLTSLFEDTLGRKPDGYALAVGVPAMQGGMTVTQLTTGLVSSPEYIAQHVSATASSVANETAYVSSLYSTVLGRTADSAGLNAWVNAIETRALTLNQVAAAIVGSPEAATSSTSILVRDRL